MLIGIGKDLIVHVLEGSIHGNHHYFLFSRGHGMALFLVLFNRCRVPLFPVRESPSALSGRARILMSGVSQSISSGSRSPAPLSPLVGRVVNFFLNPLLPQERSSSTDRIGRGGTHSFEWLRTSISSPLLWAGVLGRWAFLFLNKFCCVSPGIGLTFCYKLAEQRWIE
ncbi:hypothetical protein LINPERPRIM_LOCUS44238, partial [Linum perenne]